MTGTSQHAQLIFCIFSRDGFCHVGQADLEPLTSASQSAGIIGMSHRAWSLKAFLCQVYCVTETYPIVP